MITSENVVTIHYTLRSPEGEIIDQSPSDHPLVYLHGANTIIPGLESALEGKAVGDQFDVVVPPEQGYGEKDEDMVIELPRSQFEPGEILEVGAEFEMEIDEHDEIATIVEVKEDSVIADFNHPLAGETLHFSVSVIDIRNATETEIEHGHAHDGDDSHGH
jgi:FKBP-type peptidyl-prolyl cis-trans isomerase SlyD